MEDINFFKNYDNNDLKHAIKSLTGVVVSDDFISILQKQIASNGDTEIDFDEFREAFSQITKSLYPNGILGGGDGNASGHTCESKSQSNPPSPPPTPQRSRTNSCSSSISQLSDLPSPPNSPRNSDSGDSFSPYSFSPLSSSPPKFIYMSSNSNNNNNEFGGSPPKPTFYSTTANIFSKPPPPSSSSPRRPRSSSVRSSQPVNIVNKEPLNDDQHIMLMNHNHNHSSNSNNNNNHHSISNSTFNSPSDKLKYRQQHYSHSSSSSSSNSNKQHSNNNNNNNLHSNQLFKSLLSMDEGYSDTKKSKSKSHHHHHKRSPVASMENSDNEGPNNNQFHMDIDFSQHFNNKNSKKQQQMFSYKIQEDTSSSSSSSSSDNESIYNNLYFNNQFGNSNSNSNSSKKKNNKIKKSKSKDEIEWATEEFYYDPSLDNLDDLHQVIAILKEKYSLYSNKSVELEKKVQTALKINNQLEDDLDGIKKDCITLSLSNQALKKNNQLLEASLEHHSNTVAQIKLGCFNLEKENQILKKRLQLFEDQMEKNQILLESTQRERELQELKFNNEIEQLTNQYSKTIQSVRNEYQKEFELEFKRNRDLLNKNDLKSMEFQLENQQLKTMLLESKKNLEALEKLYDEKIKEYQSHQEESQSQTISQEILSTENQKLKKQIKKSEMQKILELKNEIKRAKKERLDYKSLLLDIKTIESSINNKFKENNK